MKTNQWFRNLLGLAVVALAGVCGNTFAAEASFARITSVRIEGTNVVVDVEASTDFTKVTLESSTRLGRRAWLPRAVELIDSTGAVAQISFTVTFSPALEVLRVRGDRAQESLPAEFYTGTNQFNVAGGALAGGGGEYGGGGPTAGPGDGANGGDRGEDSPSRSVVESDIWKLDGDTLFFFNQYRGLQVIDVSDPDSPEVTGTYDLPGAGEQMYVLNGTNVVLLARDNCGWYGTDSQSRVVLLQLRDGQPHLVKEMPVPGQIAESRLVGSALYVVANSYQRQVIDPTVGDAVSESWDWGSEVVSFDISDFATAEQKSRDWVRGYGNVIMATDEYLFVSQQTYDNQTQPYSSVIHSYDISSPNGAFTKLASFRAGGIVRDKFKMHVTDDGTFVVVVQLENWQIGQRSTHVRTFSFADATDPELLADLKIIENEQLFATRFDGERLYAVTFRVIDPLWIIDLSNPAEPKKLGELEIPGWSTFLQPMGDRLLAIGIDQTGGFSRTAVQLFDVADAANPTLLSKVLIGEQWSGSEANWDEKAFGVLPEENLVLVPFHASGAEGYLQGVQLIDLLPDTLVKRGVVEHKMGARRATVHRERLISLSMSELLTVNVTDRDEPEVVNSLQLSWAADKVHLVGDYLIEVDTSSGEGPTLRVVDAEDTFTIRSTVVLTNLPYLGSAEFQEKLYVLQGRGVQYVYPEVYNPTNYFPTATNPAVLVVTSFDLANLPNLAVEHQVSGGSSSEYLYGKFDGLQVRDDLLVWATSTMQWYPFVDWIEPGLGGIGAGDVAVGRPEIIGPWWGGRSGYLIALDVSGEAPKIASEVKLTGTNMWWNFSDSFTANGLVYLSHQTSEYDPTIDPPPYVYQTWDGKTYVTVTNDPPPGSWVQRHYLDVVDFADAEDPLVRPRVNIPGTLIGVDRDGEMIHTRGYDGNPFTYSGEETISALSYDGIAAHLVAKLAIKNAWPRPAISEGGMVYLGSPATTSEAKPALEVWRVTNDGAFQQVKTVTLNSPAQQLEKIGDLLVVQSSAIELFDATNPADLKLIGAGDPNICYGVALDGADGDVRRGLWLPIGWYGVMHIPAGGGE